MGTAFWSTSRSTAVVAAAAAAILGLPDMASAQFARTGQSTVACGFGVNACDADWSVAWYGISGLTAGQSGSLANAALATSIPTPPWSANIAGVQQWIAATPNATLIPNTSGNENNYRYFFQTVFSEALPATLTFGLGWDNKLVGAYVGNISVFADGSFDASGATSLIAASVVAPYAGGRSGFCRDGDGVFPSNAFPNCLTDVSVAVAGGQPQTLTFILQGDGTTDGLLAGSASRVMATPEPASLVLMASGLLALGGVAARRRARKRA
jgi:hypothetical protein